MTTPAPPLQWDAFIAHASEDKDNFVRPLAHALTALGAKVWYDEFSLKIGDSLSASIDKGLGESRFGIVVLSSAFMSKLWPQRELKGLVACEMDGRSVILPVWHGVTRADVLKLSPPLADKLAANTENSTADRIALQILSVIRPDISGKTPYDDLKRIASGETTRELQEEITRIREKLKEFQCPVCGSDLVASNLVPIDPEEKDWEMRRRFECGFEDLGGGIQRPCPKDPNFPKIEDYELHCTENPSDLPFFRWTCVAFPVTDMARRVSLPTGYGSTEASARLEVEGAYDKLIHPSPYG